ncbi:MAG: pyridoxamine 5'-phosphate oxidase family protein [Desulfuromonadales bacterium]
MGAMRRSEREVSDIKDIEAIIRQASVCRLGLSDDNRPYIVPLNFGYRDNALFFHSAYLGKKIEILKRNNHVCFEFDMGHELVKADKACDCSMKYQSVIGFGTAAFIENIDEKKAALAIIMAQYSSDNREFDAATVNRTAVVRVDILSLTGKRAGY